MNTVSAVVMRDLGLGDRDIQEMRKMFEMFDQDSNGVISAKEFRAVLQMLGQTPTDADMKEWMRKTCKDGEGIDFQKFVMIAAKSYKSKPTQSEEIQQAFKLLDRDGNGFISVEELRTTLVSMKGKRTEAEITELLRRADQNKDGHISYEEFKEYMEALK